MCNCWDFAKSIKESTYRKKIMLHPLIKYGNQVSFNSSLGNKSIIDLFEWSFVYL